MVYHLRDAAYVEADAGDAASHGLHDGIGQVLFQRRGDKDIYGVVDIHELVFVSDEIQRIDLERQ